MLQREQLSTQLHDQLPGQIDHHKQTGCTKSLKPFGTACFCFEN